MEDKKSGMSLDQLIELVLFERLDAILKEKNSSEDKEKMDCGESVIDSLPQEQKEAIQSYLNVLLDQEAENTEKAYLGGFHDAVGLLFHLVMVAIWNNK